MKLLKLAEMAKAISAKTCGKCGNVITDRNYYYYKGQYFHKGGCNATTAPAAPGTQPATPSAPRVAKPAAAPQSPADQRVRAINQWLHYHGIKNAKVDPATGVIDVDGDVEFDVEDITALPYQFGTVTGDFSVGGMPLTTLKGCPHTVGESFECSHTDITSFEGGPKQVGRNYLAGGCKELVSLQGLPEVVPGILALAMSNYRSSTPAPVKVTTLDGISKRIGSLILPAGPLDLHNIHKKIDFIRNQIVVYHPHGSKAPTVIRALGLMLIQGLRDGIASAPASTLGQTMSFYRSKIRDMYNYSDQRQSYRKSYAGAMKMDIDQVEELAYDDLLSAQEALIDAGYGKIAKL